MSGTKLGGWVSVAGLGLGVALVPQLASAHFTLMDPASSTTEDALGNPQKMPPCGDDGTATPTGDVTAVQTGSTITITIRETIFHPGHYRVALAPNDPTELPPEPVVTEGVGTPCGTAAIMDPPVFPVLADGMLVHTTPFSGPQSFDVQLPPGMTCDHCVLQIIEFMSNHPLNVPGGCFYHHCATLSIHDVVVADAGMSEDASTSVDAAGTDASSSAVDAASRADAATSTPPPQACACSAPGRAGGGEAAGLGALVLAALIASRRRR